MRFQPEHAGADGGIDPGLFPPTRFVAKAVQLAMVAAAERHGELIADLAPQRAALCEPQMMGVDRFAAADQARLFGDESDVVLVADASRL